MSEEGARLFEELMRFRPDGLTANGWAVKAGVSRTIWADLRRHGNPSRRTLEKLLDAAGSSLAEFEALRVGHSAPAASDATAGLAEGGRGWRPAPLQAIPLFAASVAGEWGEAGSGIELHGIDRSRIVGQVDRPPALAADKDAYAIKMAGQSMWPRFRAGRRLLISPAAPIEAGDDVLVQLGMNQALIGEMARRTTKHVELRQFNPDVTFHVSRSDVSTVHKVAGEAI